MKKENVFVKKLILHIRYPWTAGCILVMWIGLAIMCAITHFAVNEIIILTSTASVATLIIALIGFRS